MGYYIHITRAESHLDSERRPIRPEEWLRLVEEDPELCLAGYNGPYHAIWDGPSEYPEPWFDWWAGEIQAKNPGDAMVDKAVEIGKKLGAKVQGDDGETYIGGGRHGFVPPPHDGIDEGQALWEKLRLKGRRAYVRFWTLSMGIPLGLAFGTCVVCAWKWWLRDGIPLWLASVAFWAVVVGTPVLCFVWSRHVWNYFESRYGNATPHSASSNGY